MIQGQYESLEEYVRLARIPAHSAGTFLILRCPSVAQGKADWPALLRNRRFAGTQR